MEDARPAEASSVAIERRVVWLMAAIQFVNVLDFMMVNPLGPDFAAALSIPMSRLPLVAGAYTLSASVAGLSGSFFLERFDRKRALVVALAGLAAGTAIGGLAVDMTTLVLGRLVAGAFGGPATSLAVAIVADAIPVARRGKAMGVVMGGFSLASVFGVPAGLKLAEWGGWRMTFFGVAALIGAVTVIAGLMLPNFRGHLAGIDRRESRLAALGHMLKKHRVLLSLTMTALANVGGFMLIFNFPAFIQFNVGYPRSSLDTLYLYGGLAALVTMRFAGPLVDRVGSTAVGAAGTFAMLGITYVGFVHVMHVSWVVPLFVAFFVTSALRNISYGTLTSQVPEPAERARFLSIQSAVQHAASAVAALVSTQLLTELPDKSLGHFTRVSVTSMALSVCVPVAMWFVERAVRSGRAAPQKV